jgi:hypothetical protein
MAAPLGGGLSSVAKLRVAPSTLVLTGKDHGMMYRPILMAHPGLSGVRPGTSSFPRYRTFNWQMLNEADNQWHQRRTPVARWFIATFSNF